MTGGKTDQTRTNPLTVFERTMTQWRRDVRQVFNNPPVTPHLQGRRQTPSNFLPARYLVQMLVQNLESEVVLAAISKIFCT